MKLSDPDRLILREIQRDSARNLAEIAERANMAPSTAWRKLQELEKAGVITGRVALLDPAKVGAKLAVLATIRLSDHSEEAIAAFTSLVRTHPEIMECHKVSGSSDYFIKVRVADVEEYEEFMTHNLLRNPYVKSVESRFVLKQIKSTTELPL